MLSQCRGSVSSAKCGGAPPTFPVGLRKVLCHNVGYGRRQLFLPLVTFISFGLGASSLAYLIRGLPPKAEAPAAFPGSGSEAAA